jgi:hypothetical protein
MAKIPSVKTRGAVVLLVVALIFLYGWILSSGKQMEQKPVDLPRGSIYYTGPMVTKPKGAMMPVGPPQRQFNK